MSEGIQSALRVGVDVGGTFTDVVVVDERGRLSFHKTASTLEDQSIGVMMGISEALVRIGRAPGDVGQVLHGTTTATNALLERKGAPTALLTTKGFRDVLQIGRQVRSELYSLRASRPVPFISGQFRYETDERTRHTGVIEKRVNEADVVRAIERMRSAGIESVAICFLHSYANAENELTAARLIRELAPELAVSVSSEILPEFREFERMSTTVLNAYVQPLMAWYLDHLVRRLKDGGASAPLLIMQGNGGLMQAKATAGRSVNTLLSGPAGGVLGAAFLAGLAGFRNCITADVGGTSFDVSTVIDGQPTIQSEGAVEGYPVRTPHIDIHTIGAGGGSIAWIDRGGGLRVGPQSAGAMPGPVCYGRGGRLPTVTDAHAVLGHLPQRGLLSGNLQLNVADAEDAIRNEIARPLHLSLEAAAQGILDVANAAMTRAIRVMTVERGLDPRKFAVIAYGGAGPLHAIDLARSLGIHEVIVPLAPGNFSAFGLLVAPIRYDAVRTYQMRCEDVDLGDLENMYAGLTNEVGERLKAEGFGSAATHFVRQVDLRYYGQAYEISVDAPADRLTPEIWQTVIEGFHRAHESQYGYCKDDPLELVNVRVAGLAAFDPISIESQCTAPSCEEVSPSSQQRAYFSKRWCEASVYERDKLGTGSRVQGPAIVEENGATTILDEGDTAVVDQFGNIVMTLSVASS